MSDKKLNAIKEIEYRIQRVKIACDMAIAFDEYDACQRLEHIDNLLFDINDFINDLKDE